MIANERYQTDDEKRRNQNVFAYAVSFGLAWRRRRRSKKNKTKWAEEKKKKCALMERVIHFMAVDVFCVVLLPLRLHFDSVN